MCPFRLRSELRGAPLPRCELVCARDRVCVRAEEAEVRHSEGNLDFFGDICKCSYVCAFEKMLQMCPL